MRYVFGLLSLPMLLSVALADEPAVLRPEAPGTVISRSTVLAEGDWLVPGSNDAPALVVRTDGVTLDLRRAVLRGAKADAPRDKLVGVGILVEDAKDVVVRGGSVAGYKVGIRAVNAPGLLVEDVDGSGNFRQRLKSTPEGEDASDWLWPHHNDEGEWESRYGAAISLNDCEGATVRRCRSRRGQNGLLLTHCTKCFVYDNDFSFNSGWGVAMYRTTRTEVSHNRLDFCVRGYSHGVYYRGQDSAAILVFEQSSHNVFVRNSATHSGDGFFLYAGHETTQRTGEGGSNHNQVFFNDFRFAVANGIEATFSTKNVFAANKCDGCDHGIWGGYSYESEFDGNDAHDCMTAGISVEHGHRNAYRSNDISGARYGIHLWWDEDKQLLESVYGRKRDCTSSQNAMHANHLGGQVAAVRLDGDTDGWITSNVFTDDRAEVQLLGTTTLTEMAYNRFDGALTITNGTAGPIDIMDPRPKGGLEIVGEPVELTPATPPPPGTPRPPPAVPKVRGTMDTSYPEDMPYGREQMRIDEWGPLDPRETVLFPKEIHAPGTEAKVHLLGRGPFRVLRVTDRVYVEPMEGQAPATLIVKTGGGRPPIQAFEIDVEAGGKKHVARGTLTRIEWLISFFGWEAAQHPIDHPAEFAKLLRERSKQSLRGTELDFPWRGGGPVGVRADRFATSALGTVKCTEATSVRLRVVSDDGVRVEVNGQTVIERWDRHGPTEDVAEVDLCEGDNHISVTHFELDGWAWLSLRLEPVD